MKAALDEKRGNIQTLVKTAACAMQHQQRAPCSGLCIFDRPAGGLCKLAAAGNPGIGQSDVMLIKIAYRTEHSSDYS